MAEIEKKPRDIKDLKARLGRTVTPGQSGRPASMPPAAGSFPPPAGIGGRPPSGLGSRPPSGLGARPPSSSAGLPSPASGVAAPLSQPYASKGLPTPGGIAAPPFIQQQKQDQRPAVKAVDPFAQAVATGYEEKKVTLVIDDSAVKSSEIGKKSSVMVFIVLGVGIIVGLILGFMVGNTTGDRKLWKMVIDDTKNLYSTVNETSKAVEDAKTQVQTLYATSQGGPGRQARVDYSAIEKLVAMKKPISANAFYRKRYMAFQSGTVDDIFDYVNNINILWDKFALLGAMTAGAKKREALDKSANATDSILNNEYGLIPFVQGEGVAGGIVYVELPQLDESEQEDEKAQLKVLVSSKVGSNQLEKIRFVGQKEISVNPSDYVIMINKSRSMGILGQAANQFAEFRAEVTKLNLMMNQTMEIQGRLIKTMGEVAARY
ncbi:MAG: hypothetical protein JXA30_06795 [Deltaproteobacteria bacterium]|nr:hypothetical protein [Deltaproteobacteria bacterium]